MARIRTIKPQFFTSEDICRLSAFARLLFQGLWCEADREGYLEDRPFQLKMRLLPVDDCNVDALLWELAGAGLIDRYRADDGKDYIRIVTFLEHQRPHPKEPKSFVPQTGSRRAVEKNGEQVILPGYIPSSPVGMDKEYGDLGREGDGKPPLPLTAKRNLHAEYEHPRFDVPVTWHIRTAKGLANGEARLLQFYRWLTARVDRTNEDTLPRFEWLDRCFKEWLEAAQDRRLEVPVDTRHAQTLKDIEAGKYA